MRWKPTKSAEVIVFIVNATITALIWTFSITAMPSVANPMFGTPLGKELLKRSKAADIKTWMDPEVDPCTDFYQFACGKWQRINSAQLFGDYTTDQFQDMTKGIQQKVDRLLTEPKTGDFIEDKLRDFYDACRTTKDQGGIYKEALQKVYSSFGQFSYLKARRNDTDNQNSTSVNFNWWSTVAKINRIFGKSIIISVDVLDDVKDTNRTMVYIGPPEFTMTQTTTNIMHHLQEAKIYIYMKKYLDIPPQEAKTMASDLMAFETTLSQGATDVRSGKTVDELLTLYNLTDLRTEYSDLFDFEIFLTLALNTTQLPQQVYLYDRTYLQHLMEVFNNTDAGIVEDYILWLLLEEYMVDAREDNLNKWCSEKSKKYFGKFIDYAIYKQYRSAEYEKGIFTLWDEIKSVFRENLLGDHYYWMSNDTRKHALEKLENMKLFINSYEDENFDLFFSQLKIDPSNYVANIYNVLQCSEAMRLNKLDKKPDGIEEAQVLSFTPVYNSFENSIKIPVALLQPYRLWHPEYPIAMKYATLGFLLAHEMIHGFDDEGRNYDALGHTNNWWDEMSSYEFESRRRCFQAQYHNYTYAGRHLPESISQPENIADNAGVKIAYLAYKNWLEKEKHNRTDVEAGDTFKNLAYNNHELFFISYAQLWCEDVQTLFKRLLATSDNHAPGMYRVIGSLSNFHLFSWIFKCDMKPETPMNPSIKCELY